MRRNDSYLSRSRTGEARKAVNSVADEDGDDEDALESAIIKGMFESDDVDSEALDVSLDGITKSDKELAASRRESEREDLARRIADHLDESLDEVRRAMDRQGVSKDWEGESDDPAEQLDRVLGLLDEYEQRTGSV